ncbi:MAG: hypothetical protein Kow0089_01960 [Desulfobulbaceae bacterium]
MSSKRITIQGTVLDEDTEYTLHELCGMFNIPMELVFEMIDEGMIRPRGPEPRKWRFSAFEIRRVEITLRLQRDLRVNLPGCALVLDLLEELEELRRQRRLG